jgi:diaminopimelate decarboxylase
VHEFRYEQGILKGEDVDLRTVAATFGTPLFVYSKNSLLDHCRTIEQAFEGKRHTTYYAVKANANRALLRLIAGEGLGADVGSGGELHLALAAGFRPDRITFSGVGKRDDEIASALREGIHAFNVESSEELEIMSGIASREQKRARILLRVNLDIDPGGHAYISTSKRQNKFGVPWQQATEFLRWAATLHNIDIGGIHSHIGSQIVREETFLRAAEALRTIVHELRGSGLRVDDLDFGGGFGVQYKGYVQHPRLPFEEPEEQHLSAASLVRAVLPILESTGCRISIQPGRSIVAHAGLLLVRVVFRKQTEEKTFVVVDGGMNDLIRPALYHAHHQIVPVELGDRPHETVDVVGPLCESGDFLALDRPVPRVNRGDLLAVMCAGAYGYVLSSNYNARLRPAEILIDGGSATTIRARETFDDL